MLNPAKHLTLTFSFVWIIIVSNIITVAVCFLFLKQLAKITNIRGALLIPFLLLLIYLGGFTAKNSFGDMLMVLIFGALGWFMVQFDWQRPPLLVGLVLGTITERNFWISTRAYGAGWLYPPGSSYHCRFHHRRDFLLHSPNSSREESIPNGDSGSGAGAPDHDAQQPGLSTDLRAFLCGAVCLRVARDFFRDPPHGRASGAFPACFLAFPVLALALLAFGQELFKVLRRATGAANPGETTSAIEPAVVRRRAVFYRRMDSRFLPRHLAFGFCHRRAGGKLSIFSLCRRREMVDQHSIEFRRRGDFLRTVRLLPPPAVP